MLLAWAAAAREGVARDFGSGLGAAHRASLESEMGRALLPCCLRRRDDLEPVNTYALSEQMGISRQGVDKIKKKAMEKLKRACEENEELREALSDVCGSD